LLGQDGRLARRGGADGAPDAAERGANVLGIRRRFEVGEPMGIADGSAAAGDGACSRSLLGFVRQIGRLSIGAQI
jgi:hypothetical protein